jgi:hypothetical protein
LKNREKSLPCPPNRFFIQERRLFPSGQEGKGYEAEWDKKKKKVLLRQVWRKE